MYNLLWHMRDSTLYRAPLERGRVWFLRREGATPAEIPRRTGDWLLREELIEVANPHRSKSDDTEYRMTEAGRALVYR
jgi:hypothetical protein